MIISNSQASIMIVDDEPENLNVLESLLDMVGYRVSAFPRGETALVAAREEPPDLVLLDIMMPGMGGFEVCKRFKEVDRLRHIPIIFISAFAEIDGKVNAFQVGGVDYVLKPFAEVEVLARVSTHLRLRRYQAHLEELVQQRVAELAEAHRRLLIWDEAKDQWLKVLSHEMRAPFGGLLGISELLFGSLPPGSAQNSLRAEYDNSCRRINKLLDGALTAAHIDVKTDAFVLHPVPLAEVLRDTLDVLAEQAPACRVHAGLDAVEGVVVKAKRELLQAAILDLLRTATYCVADGEDITVEAVVAAGRVKMTIATSGKSLSAEALDLFFEVGGQSAQHKVAGDFGLGAALSSRIIRFFSGHVAVRNGAQRGVVITLSLPAI